MPLPPRSLGWPGMAGGLALAGGLLAGVLSPLLAQPADLAPRQIYQQTLPAVVWISNDKQHGSGWVYDVKARLLITNAHVVADAAEVRVHFPRRDGRGKLISERDLYPAEAAVNAKVLHRDTARDLALLQVPRCPPGTSALRLAADEPDPGERVHLVGCPTGSESLWVYSQGCVRQHLKFIERDEAGLSCRVMQTQLPGSAGESGAPVVNDQGLLVGVHRGVFPEAQLLSLEIALSEVRAFLAKALPKPSADAPVGPTPTER
jgi:S1-C subfamily serine protease